MALIFADFQIDSLSKKMHSHVDVNRIGDKCVILGPLLNNPQMSQGRIQDSS